jgi:hypothetical protein
MPKQTVTIELEVPEGYEATGEYRCVRYGEVYLDRGFEAVTMDSQRETNFHWPILRRKPDPVQEWLAACPKWIPEGVWIYRNHNQWRASRFEPKPIKCDGQGYTSDDCGASLLGIHSVDALVNLLGGFTPPPVDCLQVKRGKE